MNNTLLGIQGSTELFLISKVDFEDMKRDMEWIFKAVNEVNKMVEKLARNCTEKI